VRARGDCVECLRCRLPLRAARAAGARHPVVALARPCRDRELMEFFAGIDEVPAGFGPSAVTIGKFDGVHTGHRAVLTRLQQLAADRGLTSVVVTFDRHPLELLAPAFCPSALVSNDQKSELL